MTIVTISCPYCKEVMDIIIEACDEGSYTCHKCNKEFHVVSTIEIFKDE